MNENTDAYTQPEKSYSPNLSTSSLSVSDCVSTSPSEAHKLPTSTIDLPSVSVPDSQFPIVAVTTSASAVVEEPFRFDTASQLTSDDLFFDKKKDAQDIVSALQGSFNFLQDSEIDEDSMYYLVVFD